MVSHSTLAREARNQYGRYHPVPGNIWHEMYALQYLVVHVSDTHVVYSDHVVRTPEEQTLCANIVKVVTREGWEQLLCYDSGELSDTTVGDMYPPRAYLHGQVNVNISIGNLTLASRNLLSRLAEEAKRRYWDQPELPDGGRVPYYDNLRYLLEDLRDRAMSDIDAGKEPTTLTITE